MTLYRSYQLVGGVESWTVCRDDEKFDEIKPTFITVLSCDTLMTKDSPKTMIEGAKYLGPLYFDLDDANDVGPAIEGAQLLWSKLKGYGLSCDDVEIYLSGKKGLHLLVQPVVFMEKVAAINKLPQIYKEIAFNLAVDTMDFSVYSARRGRMLRTHYNVRDNQNYKVQITTDELENLTAESYQEICKTPRPLLPKTPVFRAALSILYETVRQRIMALKKVRTKPVDAATLRRHLPIVQRLMNGENVKDGVGFNKIAIQLALYAHEAKLTEDAFIDACAGLINKHNGDGYRYNSASKRQQELRRMYSYLEEGTGYEYAIGPISAMLAERDEFAEDTDTEESDEESGPEEDNSGIFVRNNNYFAATEQGDRHIMDGRFKNVSTLLDMPTDSIALIKATFVSGNRSFEVKHEREIFSNNSMLHKAVSSKGASFTGTDIHARYIYTHMLKETKNGSNVSYVTTSEGLDLVVMPHSAIVEARTPFLIWADASSVRIPESLYSKGLRMELAPEDNQPLLKTDLINNPRWPDFVAERPENAGRFQIALEGLLQCQEATSIGNMVGWTVATFFTQLFRKAYTQFPLMHIAGPAGTGKSQMMTALMRMFYKEEVPQIFAANSTIFSLHTAMGSSASIPVVLDEYKPAMMHQQKVEDLRSAFRSNYNGQPVTRGGGNRMSSSFKSLSYTHLTGPVVFIAEAPENETAILHRSVLITLKRLTGRNAAKSAEAWANLQEHGQLLGILGAHLVSTIITKYSVAKLREEFDPIYKARLAEWMPKPEDTLENTPADVLKMKQNMQERVIFNYSVAEFGFKVFKSTVELFFPDKVEYFNAMLAPIQAAHYYELANVISSAIPEYLKVMDVFSDMSRFPPENPARLTKGVEFEIGSIGGKATLVIVGRLAYNKYRMYCKSIMAVPLYTNAESYVQSMKNSPVFIAIGTGTKTVAQETMILDYEEIQRKGIYAFFTK